MEHALGRIVQHSRVILLAGCLAVGCGNDGHAFDDPRANAGLSHPQPEESVEQLERNRALVRRFVSAGNARDYAALESLVAPDVKRHSPSTPDVVVNSFADLRAFLEEDARTFPDAQVAMEALVADGDRVAFWATYSGTQNGPMGPFPATGRRATEEFAGVFRIEGDRIAEMWVVWDNVSLLRQLGHM